MGPLKGPSGHSDLAGASGTVQTVTRSGLCDCADSALSSASFCWTPRRAPFTAMPWKGRAGFPVSTPSDELCDPRQGHLAFGPWVLHQKNNKNNQQTNKQKTSKWGNRRICTLCFSNVGPPKMFRNRLGSLLNIQGYRQNPDCWLWAWGRTGASEFTVSSPGDSDKQPDVGATGLNDD